jgi:hypothetical protein
MEWSPRRPLRLPNLLYRTVQSGLVEERAHRDRYRAITTALHSLRVSSATIDGGGLCGTDNSLQTGTQPAKLVN